MPSDGTALSAGSTSGLGRHGTRVDGERVLLPARKVTRKQPAEEGRDEKRAERSADPPSSSGRARGVGEQDAEVRVVGDRVLLPARKVTRKRAMKSEDAGSSPAPDGVRKDPADAAPGLSKASASTSSSARARAMQTSGTAHTSAPVAFPEGPPASPTGAAGAAGVSAPAVVVDRFSTPKGTPSDAKEQRAGSPPRVGGHAQAQDMAPGTSTPRVPSPTPQPSTSSSAAPARRRKYSLRAAFGLPELETGATGSDGQPPSVSSPPPPPPPPPPSPPPPQQSCTPASASDPKDPQHEREYEVSERASRGVPLFGTGLTSACRTVTCSIRSRPCASDGRLYPRCSCSRCI
ncbi:hypothetical protein BC628DRAFT_253676 [Trametes gibbosa]|nr:hypothetical protein BC628DRAFT_253676 [Trametes gibbosa]